MQDRGHKRASQPLLAACTVCFIAGSAFRLPATTTNSAVSPKASQILHYGLPGPLFMVPWHSNPDSPYFEGDDEVPMALASPDGRYGLLMTHDYENPRYALLCDLMNLSKRKVLLKSGRYFSALWSPDSTKVVVNNQAAPEGSWPTLFRIDTGTSNSVSVLGTYLANGARLSASALCPGHNHDKEGFYALDWSADSKRILFYYEFRHNFETWKSKGAPRGCIVYDTVTARFSVDVSDFAPFAPSVDAKKEPLASAIRRALAACGRRTGASFPVSVIGWQEDKRRLVLAVFSLRPGASYPDVLPVIYNQTRGTVEAIDWIPDGWITRCNYRIVPNLEIDFHNVDSP